MPGADDYRQYARECLRLAQGATDPDDKARLLEMAQAWHDLADKIAAKPVNAPRRPGDRDPA